MPGSHTGIYLHIVWATSGRQPLLTDQARDMAYRIVRAECDGLHVQTVALGGVHDHVHLLVRVPAVVEPSRLAKQVKGVSSHSLEGCQAWNGSAGRKAIPPSPYPAGTFPSWPGT